MRLFLGSLASAALLTAATASATPVRVTVTNIAPAGGVALTPVWIAFQNGSFDTFNPGAATSAAFERLAEDGNTAPLAATFNAPGGTQATLGGAPFGPGTSVTGIFDVNTNGAGRYFSYASMVLPTSDYFIANESPTERDLSSLAGGGTISFLIGEPGSIYDAGTEINDLAFSAGNPLFPGLPPGQSGDNQGANQNGVSQLVSGDPFAGFLSRPAGYDFAPLNFNNASRYAAIARVDIVAVPVPEPASLGLLAMGLMALAAPVWRARRSTPANPA